MKLSLLHEMTVFEKEEGSPKRGPLASALGDKSQSEVARKMGVDPSEVNRLIRKPSGKGESALNRTPRLDTLKKFSKATSVPPGQIVAAFGK